MWPPLKRPGWGTLIREHKIVHPRDRINYKTTGDCPYCKQSKGLMRYWFGENDDGPTKLVCWWCWVMLWKGTVGRYRIPVKRYWDEVATGKMQPPVGKPKIGWELVEKIYGIPNVDEQVTMEE